ncbi:polyferredoxin, heterodixulfide reductase subunit A [Candidatus Methanoperedens nitroreducens]|uniref:CoB--CoM heterodisulfide reductase iron-sulfur subunit A n=1 Tax=Candidatus Methanoperedens nitratireducens TaxID=1392998 RepID=A0A062V7W0_9EURY|nr:CoB--CoM heterodisulfide reductase iron-sulfur subunit A family protein [Candidatus Methanoperedens nitroreducens]KCZ71430.1 polyferredoxin, heterodixulfide reductase subunit A [Candidatus Methanoperedens nitroreducens]MDJ1421056.1 CoB--CoM heterodisulfide reductase iron-sulfur subunit A family protein [Candidatus Methanoperedens sp.]
MSDTKGTDVPVESKDNQDKGNQDEKRVGVFVCECGVNIGGVVDTHAVADYIATLPGVKATSVNKFTCSDSGQADIQQKIKEHNLNRVVVAACSPKTHEPTFRACIEQMGLNQYFLEFVNIRDHCSWIHMWEKDKATEKSKDLVRMGVERSKLLEPLEASEVPVTDTALVVGGGVAGMQASLDLADMGFKVYLVEKEPSIGGRMARFDKVFPTNDCSICILGPKMVEVVRNKNIMIMSYSEVKEVDGYVGNFNVKIEHKPRYLDTSKCTGCAKCSEVCPVEVPYDFNEGFGTRKAIYVPFPQAVPLRAVLDKENCINCKACARACESKAIDYDMQTTYTDLNAGIIIGAVGFKTYDPEPGHDFGYGLYDNVITAMEFERLLNAAGPTGGHVIRPSDCREPIRVGFVNCVGSRDKNTNIYCSGVCCMYTIKNAQLLKEKRPETDHTIMYIDIRTPFRSYEESYNRARNLGVKFLRGRPVEVKENPENKNIMVRVEDTLANEIRNLEFDLLVLSTGVVPHDGIHKLQQLLKLSKAADGFLMEAHPKLRPVDTTIDGVYLAGVASGPKDIPYAVSQGSACAGRATILLKNRKAITEGITAVVDPDVCAGCGVCVPMCPFQAIKMDEEAGKANVVKALCKGCGTCVTACPTGALEQSHFKNDQVLAQVKNVFRFQEAAV